jgi:hypothetical protein
VILRDGARYRVGWNTEKRNNGIGLTPEEKKLGPTFTIKQRKRRITDTSTRQGGKIRHYEET